MSLKIPQERLLFQTNVEALRCVICHEISLLPSECKSCQNIFCSECVTSWKQIKNICPLNCKGEFKIKPIHNTLKEIILSLKLSCTNNPIGCPFIGTMVEVLIHERKGCKYATIICAACKQTMLWKDSETHVAKCVFAKIECQFCKTLMMRKDFKVHNCFDELKNKIANLKWKQEEAREIIQELSRNLHGLREERENSKDCEAILEKLFSAQDKDLKGIIRKEVDKEVAKKIDKIKKLDSANVRVIVQMDDEYHKGFCCEKLINMQWIAEKVMKNCGVCNKNNFEIRYQCKICMKNFCTLCKTFPLDHRKCPKGHKFIKQEAKSSDICSKCGKIINASEIEWKDILCDLLICDNCMKPKKTRVQVNM